MTDRVLAAFDALAGGGATRRELDRGGRALRWIEAGAGPSVVLEAGAMSPVVGYAAVVQELVADFRVIAYDRAGYGASEPAPLSLELQVDDLIAVLEDVGPAAVVGHSWGGLLAQLATWSRPDLLTGLVLLDPSHETFWRDAEPEPHADRTRPPADDPRAKDVLAFGDELAADVSRSVKADRRLKHLLTEACRSYLQTDDQLFTYLDELPMILDHVDELAARRTRAVWPKIPIVVLTATKGRPAEFTPQVIAVQDCLAAQSGARHQVVPDSGHYLHIDRPDLVAECIQEVASGTS
ncbi:alpha/beta fold hydrolase [Kribbella sp. CA-245084]|uniref:alpha/beta fold hydrolase n=1 Tax=Kribbella sp. CA-245084 TaxID=3239940 RepID=UPI003D91873D